MGHITRCIGIQSNVSTSFLFTNTLCYPYGYLDLLQCVLRSTANQLCHSLLEGAGFWLSHKETVLGRRTRTKSLLFLPVFPLLTQFCLGSTLICNDTLQVSFSSTGLAVSFQFLGTNSAGLVREFSLF